MLATSNRVVVVDAVMAGRVVVAGVVAMHARTTASRIAAAVTLVQVATKE
jgi:hypothetical protein